MPTFGLFPDTNPSIRAEFGIILKRELDKLLTQFDIEVIFVRYLGRVRCYEFEFRNRRTKIDGCMQIGLESIEYISMNSIVSQALGLFYPENKAKESKLVKTETKIKLRRKIRI